MENKDVQYLINMLYEMIDGAKGVLMSPDKCIIVREDALDLLDELKGQLPKELEKAVQEQLHNLEAQLAQQGLNLEMYCQFMQTTKEALREEARGNAVASVKVQAAIEEIVSIENLEATEAEMGEAMAVIARQNRMTVEQLKPYVDAAFTAAVTRSVLTSKVMKLIRDAAEIE